MESLAAQDGTPALSDVSADRIDGEHRPRLLRAALGGRNISRTNEYQANLPQRRRLDECETDRSEQQAVSNDLMGAGRQPRRSRSSGQQMDGVPVSAGLCPGVHISVSEPVEHGVGRRIKSGLQSREFPLVDGVLPWRQGTASELVGHRPAPPRHRNLGRRLKELPPCALDLPDRAPIGRGRPRGDAATRGARIHTATAVHQAIPGSLSPAVPQPALDPVQGMHSGEDRCRSPPGLAVSLAVRHFGRARCEHPTQDCCEPLDGVVTGA